MNLNRAFILGAGLGTRLRPITENLPKPLVPVRGKPIVHYALEHLQKLGVKEVIINTHHASEKWIEYFPQKKHGELKLEFRHEPVLLETGGGLKNVEDFFPKPSTFIIYNGDILTTMPLEKALRQHEVSGNLATMVLRSKDGPKHVSVDEKGRIIDIRGKLGTGHQGEYLFTGIHVLNTDIFTHIPDARPQSIINIYLELIAKKAPIGGVILDEGEWSDIGTIQEYERVNR